MFLGIDLGTSELKLLLLSAAHQVVATAHAPLSVSRPQPLWCEQAPADWWQALEAAMAHLVQSHPQALAEVRAVGLSGQMHGAVLLDANDAVLRPAILWNDGRSAAQCEALMRAVPALTQITGNLAMPGFTAPKLQWVREHEPDLFARTARVLLPKDWLRLRLTGAAITDMSDASGTLWLDVARRDWSDVMLAATGLTRAHMPALVEGSAPAGTVRGELARRWGLRDDVVVAGGGGDNAASAVGIGAVEAGQGFVSLGTSGVIFVVSDAFRPNPQAAMHAFCHALPARWHQMSVMLSAASALDWAARLTGQASAAALVECAATLSPAQRARAPIFLPYLSGERTPHNDPLAQGVLFGLTHEHDAAAIGWAALEGVSFGLLDGLRSLALAGDALPTRLALVGGGARSEVWGDLLASVLGIELEVHGGNEAGGALGAARLGWLAVGGELAEVCRVRGEPARVHRPDPQLAPALGERHQRFRKLYGALAPACLWLAAVSGSAQAFTASHYELALRPDLEAQMLHGHARILLKADLQAEAQASTSLDLPSPTLQITRATLAGQPLPLEKTVSGWRVSFSPAQLKASTLWLELDYLAPAAEGLVFGAQYVYTAFHTCQWLPCAGPELGRATIAIRLGVPAGYRSVSSEHPTQPYPLYTLGFAAGRFTEAFDVANPKQLRYLGTNVDAAALRARFKSSARMLAFFEARAGVRLPHPVYTQVLLPGDIAQEASSFSLIGQTMLDPILEDPQEDWVIAHEMAHQWWGNLVTCAAWSEFWLNEGITVFMTAAWKQQRWGEPAYQRELALARQRWQRAKDSGFDKPLSWPGAYPSPALMRSIHYSKGALFMDALRSDLGEAAFWDGLRRYTVDNAGRSVRAQDLQTAMQASAGRSLQALFDAWAY